MGRKAASGTLGTKQRPRVKAPPKGAPRGRREPTSRELGIGGMPPPSPMLVLRGLAKMAELSDERLAWLRDQVCLRHLRGPVSVRELQTLAERLGTKCAELGWPQRFRLAPDFRLARDFPAKRRRTEALLEDRRQVIRHREVLELARDIVSAPEDPKTLRAAGRWVEPADRADRTGAPPAPVDGPSVWCASLEREIREYREGWRRRARDGGELERRMARQLLARAGAGHPTLVFHLSLPLSVYLTARFRVRLAVQLLQLSSASPAPPEERRRRIAEACALPLDALSWWDHAGYVVTSEEAREHGVPQHRPADAEKKMARQLTGALFGIRESRVQNLLR